MPQLDQHALYELDILKHVESSSTLTNRVAAQKLGVSIKLAHEILKRMVHKGLLHVRVINTRRWDYFLTPRGLAEKTRLTVEFLDFSLYFYREARRRSAQVCRELAEQGRGRVVFLGAGDLAEIAYLGVRQWGLELGAVYDGQGEGSFMGTRILPLAALNEAECDDPILVCLYDAKQPMKVRFLPAGVRRRATMRWFFQDGA